MSFSSLPTELRLEIYSYLVFGIPEPPTEPPIIQIFQSPNNRGLSHCSRNTSPKDMYQHFIHHMIDPVQRHGSMLVEYGTYRPYLSTPHPREHQEEAEDVSSNWKPHLPQPSRINSLLLASRWLADEIRAWLYPRVVFGFSFKNTAAFTIFNTRLLPGTKEYVRALRLCIPIYGLKGLELDHSYYCDDREPIIYSGFAWKKAIPINVQESFPNLCTVHVNLGHLSRRPTCATRLAAPIGDLTWREEALEPLLRFGSLPLKEVTVIVGNLWPKGDIWSGDPRIKARRELAEWLRMRLMEE